MVGEKWIHEILRINVTCDKLSMRVRDWLKGGLCQQISIEYLT